MVLHWQLQPIPSEESLQQKLQDNTNWEAYKALTVVNHMVQHKAHGDSQFYWVNPGIYSLLFKFYILYTNCAKCHTANFEINYEIYNMIASCYTRQTKGDKDFSLSNWLAIYMCFLHDKWRREIRMSHWAIDWLYTCVSCMINALRPLLFLFCLNDKITSVQVIFM